MPFVKYGCRLLSTKLVVDVNDKQDVSDKLLSQLENKFAIL